MTIDPAFFFTTSAILGIAFYHLGKLMERREWQKRQSETQRINSKYRPAADR